MLCWEMYTYLQVGGWVGGLCGRGGWARWAKGCLDVSVCRSAEPLGSSSSPSAHACAARRSSRTAWPSSTAPTASTALDTWWVGGARTWLQQSGWGPLRAGSRGLGLRWPALHSTEGCAGLEVRCAPSHRCASPLALHLCLHPACRPDCVLPDPHVQHARAKGAGAVCRQARSRHLQALLHSVGGWGACVLGGRAGGTRRPAGAVGAAGEDASASAALPPTPPSPHPHPWPPPMQRPVPLLSRAPAQRLPLPGAARLEGGGLAGARGRAGGGRRRRWGGRGRRAHGAR